MGSRVISVGGDNWNRWRVVPCHRSRIIPWEVQGGRGAIDRLTRWLYFGLDGSSLSWNRLWSRSGCAIRTHV